MKKIVILASGNGSNARKIAEYFSDSPSIKVEAIACNKIDAGVWKVADDFNLGKFLITKENIKAQDGLLAELQRIQPDLIVLAGFLWKIPALITEKYHNKILNIHPALLPKFGGKGMYGRKVHQAVIDANEEYTGITIHYVNENYDEGHILFQKIIKIEKSDTVDDIEEKIHQLEHENFPLVLDFLLRNDY